MERISCKLQQLGIQLKPKYKTYKELPIAIRYYVHSGAFSNVYSGMERQRKTSNKLNFIKTVNYSKKYDYIVKLMHYSKNNINETKLLARLQPLITANITPCLMIMYGHTTVDSAKFYGIEGDGVAKNSNISKLTNKGKGIVVLAEYLSQYAFAEYLASPKSTFSSIKMVLFECFVALLAINHYLGISHGDFHPWNIMLLYSSTPKTRQYEIFGTKYVVKSHYMPVVIDVGGGPKKKVMSDVTYLLHFVWDRKNEVYNKLNLKRYSTLRKYIAENFKSLKTATHDDTLPIYKFL